MLYTFNVYNVICQLDHNKTGGKIERGRLHVGQKLKKVNSTFIILTAVGNATGERKDGLDSSRRLLSKNLNNTQGSLVKVGGKKRGQLQVVFFVPQKAN